MITLSSEVDTSPKPSEEDLNKLFAEVNEIIQSDVEIEALNAETAARNAIIQRDVEIEALNAKTAAKNDIEEEKQTQTENRINYPHIFSRPLPCHWFDSNFIKKAETFEKLQNLDHDEVKEKLINLMKLGLLDQAEFFQFFHTPSQE